MVSRLHVPVSTSILIAIAIHASRLTLSIAGTTDTSWEWTVVAKPDNNRPFSFRAVNAEGSQDDQLYGGFYTGQFWISEPDSSSTITTSQSLTRTTLSASTSPTRSHTATTSSTASSTPIGSSNDDNSDDNSTVAVGAGVGVGVGAAVLIAGAGAWFFIHRRKRKNQAPSSGYNPASQGPPSTYQDSMSTQQWVNNQQQWPTPNMSHASPPPNNYYYGGAPPPMKSPPSELGQPHYFVEAPGSQVEPREMDGGFYNPKPPSPR